MNRVIVNTVPFKEKSLEEILPIISNNGWYALELHINHFFKYDSNLEQLEQAKKTIQKHKLNVVVMAGGWCNFVGDETAMKNTSESIEKQVAILKALHCNVLRLFLGIIDKKDYTTEIKQNLIKRLQLLSSKYPDITFAFETHDGISLDAKVMKDLFSAVNRPNIKINFDAANLEKEGKDSMLFLKELFPWVGHMHIKGLKSKTGNELKDFYCAYGDGILSYEEIFKYLKNAGYKGYLSVEFEGEGDPVIAINNSLKNLKKDIL